jgi:anti-sigma factor ChrR (cupin superfamily)
LNAHEPEQALERLVVSGLFGPGTDFDRFAWRPFREGVEIAPLYGSGDDGGPMAALLRYAPGARVPSHLHRGNEHILVLRGSQRDERGTYEAGTLLAHGVGTGHSVTSDGGCVALAIWFAPVEIAG